MRTDNRLHRKAAIAQVIICRDVHGFKVVEQGAAFVPTHLFTAGDYVVAVKGRHGDESDILNIEFRSEVGVLLNHSIVGFLTVVYEVHLVDTYEDVWDLKEGSNEGVALGLFDHAFARIHEDEGKVGGGSTSDHIAGVLNVSRGICNDELALWCGKVAVGHINGDALLAFVLETVCEEAKVNVVESSFGRGCFNLGDLVLEDAFAVVKESADQC